jgi:hypothetical protein
MKTTPSVSFPLPSAAIGFRPKFPDFRPGSHNVLLPFSLNSFARMGSV